MFESDGSNWPHYSEDDHGVKVPSGPLCCKCVSFCKARRIKPEDLIEEKERCKRNVGTKKRQENKFEADRVEHNTNQCDLSKRTFEPVDVFKETEMGVRTKDSVEFLSKLVLENEYANANWEHKDLQKVKLDFPGDQVIAGIIRENPERFAEEKPEVERWVATRIIMREDR